MLDIDAVSQVLADSQATYSAQKMGLASGSAAHALHPYGFGARLSSSSGDQLGA